MATLLRRALISKVVKNVSKSPIAASRLNFCSGLAQVKTNNEDSVVTLKPLDQLFKSLESETDPIVLVTNVKVHKKTLDSGHIIKALTTLEKIYRKNSLDPDTIQQREEFQQFMNIMNSYMRRLDIEDVTQAIKVFNLLRIPSTTKVFQSLLQILRLSLNDLVLEQIYFITFLLRKLEPTPLSQALLVALPKVFELQLECQLDKEDFNEIKDALFYAALNPEIDRKIVRYLLDMTDARKELIDEKNSLMILKAMCYLRYVKPKYLPIVQVALDKLKGGVKNLSIDQVTLMVHLLTNKIKRGIDAYYSHDLFDAFAKKAIESQYDIPTASNLLNDFNFIYFISRELLDYIGQLYLDDPSSVDNSISQSLKVFIRGLAYANYKPKRWEEIKDLVVRSKQIDLYDAPDLLYFVYHLACLDVYDHNLIERVFTIPFEVEHMTPTTLWTVCSLYRSVKTLNPEYSGPWPSEDMIEAFGSTEIKERPKNCDLYLALEKVLGSPECFYFDLRTKLYHSIDYVVAFKNGQPIKTDSSNQSKFIEDFNFPQDSRIIILQFLKDVYYSRNYKRLLGPHQLHLKSLKAFLPHEVITIDEETWYKMLPQSRAEYLKELLGNF